jgi:hypothetical protein
MKKLFIKKGRLSFVLIIMLALVGTSFIGFTRGENTETTVSITVPISSYQIIKNVDSHVILMEDYGRLLIPGQPNLPSSIFAIALPPGAELDTLAFETPDDITLSGSYQITPVVQPQIIADEPSSIAQERAQTFNDNYKTTYSQDQPYPASPVEFVRTAGYRKYNLVDIRVSPFTYYPVSGTLVYHKTITVHLTYKQSSTTEVMKDSILTTEQTAQSIILNYAQAQNWYRTSSVLPTGVHDFVIITLDSLTTAVQPLVDWETTKGRTVEVVTTSWISSSYPGYDLAEKIRNFLIEKYPSEQWGIQDVLLVGGYDDVPMRRCEQDLGYGKPETDYYYAELSLADNQSWDKDCDHKWGENSDAIDFYTEVNVGRIPWSDAPTVQHICEKSAAYEQNNDPAFKENILLLGAFFWDNDPNPRTDNAVLMEYKVNSTLQPWMDDWMTTRMYERGYSTYPMDFDLKFNNVKITWSQGKYAFVNWAGHGSPVSSHIYHSGGGPFVSTSTCPLLNDDYPSIIFANACSNSDTDEDNLGQMMLKQGAVGFVGATKVALGCPGWKNPNYGSSQSLDYYFTFYVTSGNYTQGQALQKSLRDMYTKGLWDAVNYEMFEWGALWGNPDLSMKSYQTSIPPATPAAPSGPVIGLVNESLSFTLTGVSDPDGDQIYYCWSFGDKKIEWLGPFPSGNSSQATHLWSKPGDYNVKVKTRDSHGAESGWSAPLNVHIGNKPQVAIGNFTGGFGFSVIIQNIGTEEITTLPINISYKGGLLGRIDKTLTATISSIPVGGEVTVPSDTFFGLGTISIMVQALDQQQNATAFIIGPFVLQILET